MSVFRIEKSKNYTAMSNYHFRDMNLSLKAVGLLSKMLSLPDNWDYSQAGLAKICKDGEDAIASALKELEKCGYLVRERTRDANGRMSSMLYHVYEMPKHLIEDEVAATEEKPKQKESKKQASPQPDLPGRENPVVVKPGMVNPIVEIPNMEKPVQEAPILDEPVLEKQGQLNNNILNTNLSSTYLINQPINKNSQGQNDGLVDEQKNIDYDFYEQVREEVKTIVNYDYFVSRNEFLSEQFENDQISFDYYNEELLSYSMRYLDRIVDYMTEVLASTNDKPIKIGYQYIDPKVVQAKLRRCDFIIVKNVIKQLSTTEVKNPKNYAISMLFNS